MFGYALAVTVHDPEERFPPRCSGKLISISDLFPIKSAACTESTANRTINVLREAGFAIIKCAGGAPGQARREAIAPILGNPKAQWIQYADFDRLLHWEHAYPRELRELPTRAPLAHYTALGRTARALVTHPQVQIMAETLTNAAFSAVLRLPESMDMVAGSFVFSRQAAEVIVCMSTDMSLATDLEWPALVYRELGSLPECLKMEGLEFETADYYTDEIREAGSLESWMRQTYDCSRMWHARTKLALDSIAAMWRVLG